MVLAFNEGICTTNFVEAGSGPQTAPGWYRVIVAMIRSRDVHNAP